MSGIEIVAPASEPLTVAEAKLFLRIDSNDDDPVIMALIGAARRRIESASRCALIAQTWRFVRDCWPDDGRIRLRRGPLLRIASVRLLNEHGIATALDAESFVIDRAANLIASPAWALPAPGRAIAGIEIDAVLGFGSDADGVPDDLLHAVRLLVAHWYEHRALEREASAARLPAPVEALIAPYRVLAL